MRWTIFIACVQNFLGNLTVIEFWKSVYICQSYDQLEGYVVWNHTIQHFARSSSLSVHKLFTSCIRRCVVSRACDWVMSALSAELLTFSFQLGLLFFHILVARPHQHSGVLLVLIHSIGHRTLLKMWIGTFLVWNVQPREKTLNWFYR